MKKVLSIFLGFMLLLGLFSACGTKDTGSTTGKTEIVFLCHDGVKNPEGKYLRQIQVDAFNAANPDIHVTLELNAEGGSVEYLKKLDLLSLSGNEYDVCTLPSYANYAERAQKGTFAALKDFVVDAYSNYDEVFAYDSEIDGEYYGLPYNPAMYYVIINKDMLDEAGLDIPELNWTWDDYREYSLAMTKGEGQDKQYGSYMHTWTEYRREALFSTKMDNPYVNDDRTSNANDPVFKEWLQFIYDMENEDESQITYSDAKAGDLAYRDVFFNGDAAMVLTGSWIMDNIKDTTQFPHDFETVFAAMPIWPNGGVEGRATASCTYNAINAKSTNQEAAFKFLQFMSSEEASTLVNQLSAVKGADQTAVLTASTKGFENLYNVESLVTVWNNPKLQPNQIMQYPDLMAEIEAIYAVETELFMLGGQDLETTLKNFAEQAEEVIARET